MKAVLRKLVVCSTDGASAMAGVRAGFGAKLKALGALDCWQFTDVAHECESSVRTAVEGLAFHSEILTGLRDLSAMICKGNILAEQVDALMQRENEKSASWQGKVVQRWVEPILRLIKAVLSNAAATHKVLSKNGAHKHFGLAKKRYFDLLQADTSQMNGVDAFIKFWQAPVATESVPMPLRLYGAVVLLASPSSCDAERAISTLNRVMTALRNRMSWPMVRLHLIGAEDVDPDGYPYELVAQSWGTTAHRRRRFSQNVRKPRKDR